MSLMAIIDYIWHFLNFQNSNVLIVQSFPDIFINIY